jgi:RNA polymerase sigma-70 factor (ECF subfamily)
MAEDLAQEAFIAAHRNWERISNYDEPRAWVRRVMVNRGTSWHRRLGTELKAMARIGPRTETTESPDLSPETAGIWNEVARLPRRQRQSIVLHYVGQLSVDEIGETLECSPETVKTHLHRGRQALERRLEDWRYER